MYYLPKPEQGSLGDGLNFALKAVKFLGWVFPQEGRR